MPYSGRKTRYSSVSRQRRAKRQRDAADPERQAHARARVFECHPADEGEAGERHSRKTRKESRSGHPSSEPPSVDPSRRRQVIAPRRGVQRDFFERSVESRLVVHAPIGEQERKKHEPGNRGRGRAARPESETSLTP